MATIYKIYCIDSEIKECYIGSTEDFHTRCSEHKSRCNNTNSPKYNYKVYKYIRANGGWDNFIIKEIIDCEIEDRYDCELYYFKLFNATLNSQFPKRNKKQYYNDNKQQMLEKVKEYYLDNRQEISEKGKIKIECECGSKIRKSDISAHLKTIKHQNYINSKL
jgi:hypothetical protein